RQSPEDRQFKNSKPNNPQETPLPNKNVHQNTPLPLDQMCWRKQQLQRDPLGSAPFHAAAPPLLLTPATRSLGRLHRAPAKCARGLAILSSVRLHKGLMRE